MGFLGLAATFLPAEILNYVGLNSTLLPTLLIQITGALYLGFAIQNYMAKTILIGGIYAKPLCLGNFLHFTMAALALVKAAFNHLDMKIILIAAIAYSIFAILFALVYFTTPVQKPMMQKI
jgi:hypothetical protein